MLAGILPSRPARRQVIEALNRVLFEEESFHGNVAHYHDPRNSFLNEVLSRRTGIPITLSVLYLGVARRAGYPVLGIGMPGHFIAGLPQSKATAPDGEPGMIYIDPFNRGQILSLEDCRAYFSQRYGAEFPFSEDVLAPATNLQILTRMLNNLKMIYLQRRDHRRALAVVDRLLLIEPGAPWELRTRGLLYYRLGAFLPALADLRRYKKLMPQSSETDLIGYYVEFMKRLLTAAN
jgi:regulator of sirC expression with transglutaminase-like and TPR domain